MNPNVDRLSGIARKRSRRIIGLMSGTSLDGLDVALCRVERHGLNTNIEVLEFTTVSYDDNYRAAVRSVFSKRDVDLQTVSLLNGWIGRQHGEIVLSCLDHWHIPADSIDLVASHGQTIYHCPQHLHKLPQYTNATLQIGDGDHLAHTVGVTTCSDFRQKHIAAGGEGAPLAMYCDYFMFGSSARDRIMLNVGGIANLTLLPRSLDASEVVSSDVGPGNTLMDALVQKNCPGMHFDTGAGMARKGKVSVELLKSLKAHSFFDMSMPKTIGPELFNLDYLQAAMLASNTSGISLEDQMSTLNRFSADSIVNAISELAVSTDMLDIYASGGGAHNPLLMESIQQQLSGAPIRSTADLGIHPDAKEAVVFAVLANECVAGRAVSIGSGSKLARPVSMGKISFPG